MPGAGWPPPLLVQSMALGFRSGLNWIVSSWQFPSRSTTMNLSPWKWIVTLLAISGSSTPFQVEVSIRQVPWSRSKSDPVTLGDETCAAAPGNRGSEQPMTLDNATIGIDTSSHLIATPPSRRCVLRLLESLEPILATGAELDSRDAIHPGKTQPRW